MSAASTKTHLRTTRSRLASINLTCMAHEYADLAIIIMYFKESRDSPTSNLRNLSVRTEQVRPARLGFNISGVQGSEKEVTKADRLC